MPSDTTDIADIADMATNMVSDQLIATPGSPGILNVIHALEELYERKQFRKSASKLKSLLAEPEIENALSQREHNDLVIQIQQAEIEARQEGLSVLEQERAKFIATYDGGNKERLTAILDQKIGQVKEGIRGLDQANQLLSDQITEINSRPEIKALRRLEARKDLGHEVLKRKGDFAVDVIKGSRAPAGLALGGVRAAADLVGFADMAYQATGIASGAATGASALSAAPPLVGGATQIAGGGLQMLAGIASAANNTYHGVRDLQRKATAKEVKETIIDDPVLRAAVERIESKANRNAVERGIKTARDGALVVTGAATVVAGSALVTSGVLAAASSAGFGAAATPTLALTVAASGVGIGAAAVSTAAGAGAAAFTVGRHVTSVAAKVTCMRAIVGGDELLRIGGGAGRLPSDRNGQPVLLKDPNIPREEAEAILKLQKHAIKTGELKPRQALDVAKLREYATVRLIALDTREAVAALGGKLVEECADVIQMRGGNGIVTSDLPKDTPAVKTALGLGMTEREVVSLVNNLHAEVSHKIAEQTLAQKTGLRQKASTSLDPTFEPTWEQNKDKVANKASSLLQSVRKKLRIGGKGQKGDGESVGAETKHELTGDEIAALEPDGEIAQDDLLHENYGPPVELDDIELAASEDPKVAEKKESVADALRASRQKQASHSNSQNRGFHQ